MDFETHSCIQDVQQNVISIEKQLNVAQDILEEAQRSGSRDGDIEETLPLTEIVEELDDEDNVICMSE